MCEEECSVQCDGEAALTGHGRRAHGPRAADRRRRTIERRRPVGQRRRPLPEITCSRCVIFFFL